jgi:energy-coupling factor transporter ATP-binding protein EcfA2
MSEFTLEDSNYDLQPVKFGVDGQLGYNIKDPFPNQSFFMIIVGKAGSGKTSLLINMITHKGIYKKIFDKIVLVMPKNSRKSMKKNPFDDLPSEQAFEEFSYNVIKKVKDIREEFDELDKKRKRPRQQLLILDDITATLKNNDIQKQLIELATNRRHYKLSIILLVQFIRAIPRPVRFQATCLVFFKPSNQLDSKIVEEEYVNLPRDDYKDLTRFVWQDAHDFLFVDKQNETYYKNLQKIIFNKTY